MKKSFMFLFTLIILAGCSFNIGGQSVIDWVDFIKWDGKEYMGIHSGVVADSSFIGEKIGEVQFKVADNVTNASYRTKDGDAAFQEPGTELFAIKGRDDLLAVPSNHAINGYKVYFSEGEYSWQFQDLAIDRVNKIEIYQDHQIDGHKAVSKLTDTENIESLLRILNEGVENPTFSPNTTSRDPLYYELVFYTGEPVAYKYVLQFDGTTYYWYPWETSVLSDEIKMYLEDNE